MIHLIPTEYVPLVLAASAFTVMLLMIVGVSQIAARRAEKRRLVQKIDAFSVPMGGMTAAPSIPKGSGRLLEWLGRVGRRVAPEKAVDVTATRLKFLKAGLRGPNVPAVFWGVKFLLGLLLLVGFLAIRVAAFRLINPQLTLMIGLSLALGGFYLPDIWLHIKTDRRKQKLFEGFPEALDLMVVCVEAGMGMDAAIFRVAEEMELNNRPLSEEFKMVNLELRAGKSRKEALHNLALRTDLEDVNNLVTLLVQTDQFGTSVAQALRVYADSFRTKRYQKAEELAAKLPVKLVLPLILFIFPSLFVTIMGPALIRLYQVLLSR
jgi:tight adherence protein C